jgi:hypothetical protein
MTEYWWLYSKREEDQKTSIHMHTPYPLPYDALYCLRILPARRLPPGWAWWSRPVIPVLGRQRQEDGKFKARLSYTVRPRKKRKEGRKERRREGRKEGTKGGREGGKERKKEGRKERREGGREGGREGNKEGRKERTKGKGGREEGSFHQM